MENKISIRLQHEPLDQKACFDFVKEDSCGGIVVFTGTVRDHTQGKSVQRLIFSSYEPMAVKEMQTIAEQVLQNFPVQKVAIHHALGDLGLGEVPVIIAVSSAHRGAAFEACQYAIDTLKETVPIWKKEVFDDGEVWVNAHP